MLNSLCLNPENANPSRVVLGFAFYFTVDHVQKIKKAASITVLRGYILPLILFSTLPILLGVEGIWLAVPISELIAFLVLIVLAPSKKTAKVTA